MAIININLEKLKSELNEIEIKEEDSYLKSYQHFIDYFSGKKELTTQDLVIGSHFVYGWMPTILKLGLIDSEKVLLILNKAKTEVMITPEEFGIVIKCVNNSVVGASKLLHFINPVQYAIWDKRINRYATKRSHYGIGKVETYFEYLSALDLIEKEPDFAIFYNEVKKKIGNVTPKRAIEWVMFETDRLENDQQNLPHQNYKAE